MELNIWTNTKVLNAKQEANGKWAVTVERGDKTRVVHVDHVVFAIGVGGGTPNMPKYPGMVSLPYDFPPSHFPLLRPLCITERSLRKSFDRLQDEFEGQILHSTQHDKALDHEGKKVVVVGACTSGTLPSAIHHFFFLFHRTHLTTLLRARPETAHDIAADYANNGVDVTLYQRNPTYIMSCKEGMPRIMRGSSLF